MVDVLQFSTQQWAWDVTCVTMCVMVKSFITWFYHSAKLCPQKLPNLLFFCMTSV